MSPVSGATREARDTPPADEAFDFMDFNLERSSYGTFVDASPLRPASSPTWQTDASSVSDSEIYSRSPISEPNDLHPSDPDCPLPPAGMSHRRTPSGLRYSYIPNTFSVTPEVAPAYWVPPDTPPKLLTFDKTPEFRVHKRIHIPCVICGRVFRDERAVYQHLKAKHSHLVLADAEGFLGERGLLERQRLRYENDGTPLENVDDVEQSSEGLEALSELARGKKARAVTAGRSVPSQAEVPDQSAESMTLSIRTKNPIKDEGPQLIGMSMSMVLRPKPKPVEHNMDGMQDETCE